jgi:hypothetical protein
MSRVVSRRAFLQGAIAGAVASAPLAALAPTRTLETPLGVVSFTTESLAESRAERIGRLYSEALARSMAQTKETLAANILNRAFAS